MSEDVGASPNESGETPLFRSRTTEVGEWLDDAEGLTLGLDFDGTLAPIGADPEETEIYPDSRKAVEELVDHPRIEVTVISGRELADVVERVGIDGIDYAGNHGLEMRIDGEKEVHPDAVTARSEIEDLCAEIRSEIDHVPGSFVEEKGVTASVHFRQTPEEYVEEVVAAVEELAADSEEDIHVVSGKQIREIRPDVDWDKGRVVDRLDERAPDGWRTMYVGDDTTDEDAFRAVQPSGIGILVGDRPDTDADYRIENHEQVPSLLEWLATRASSPER
ncbi:trehalose-phosphatase [Halopelagius longus]|uniref:Trehalose 6-phosphate phosphatase n=1 Tax=Halopelagius longus TaxID=1236180 RepID=A0A1H0YLE3_9EURY|nr:trehalose-phosphatase [Halopelagius longus]SDQ16015.1 trehalose 6-phosphate phosphatase [Halopelagius longus]